MDWWAHQSCNLSHVHYSHQKIAILATPIPGSSGSREVSYLASLQATEVELTQGVKDILMHLWLHK